MMQSHKIKLAETGYFSKVVLDYINESDALKPFVHAFPSKENLERQLKSKIISPSTRHTLFSSLHTDYETIAKENQVVENIALLAHENTFTICTAHQPNIFTGYLYVIYKIAHTIRLANQCKEWFPNYNFVPIYFMGSEDNDIEEIGTFNLQEKKLRWQTTQTGACGEMSTEDLLPLRDELIATLNENIAFEASLIDALKIAYDGNNTLSEATLILLNFLFGKYGLVILDANRAALKQIFQEVFINEIEKQASFQISSQAFQNFQQHYKSQATPREINLFYLLKGIRERIIQDGDQYKVLNTDLHFSKLEILTEINNHPEHFSPNVMLRPLYQEMILPNIAFVGGGGELAYWLPLKSLFNNFKVNFPILILRNSFQIITAAQTKKMAKLNLSWSRIFKQPEENIKAELISDPFLIALSEKQEAMHEKMQEIIALGASISSQLEKSMLAHQAKYQRLNKRVQQKFKAQIKRKNQDRLNQLCELHDGLFPNNTLQERSLNYFTMIKMLPDNFIEQIILHSENFGKEMIVLEVD